MIPQITKLEIEAEGERSVRAIRDFRAARELVWRAFTEPALLERWLWARGAPMTRCEMDLRDGGSLRWEWRSQDGNVMGVSGHFKEIAMPERIVHTELFDEDWTGGETEVTTELSNHGSFARMVITVEYRTREARDAALRTPMADGMEEGYSRLDSLIAAGALS